MSSETCSRRSHTHRTTNERLGNRQARARSRSSRTRYGMPRGTGGRPYACRRARAVPVCGESIRDDCKRFFRSPRRRHTDTAHTVTTRNAADHSDNPHAYPTAEMALTAPPASRTRRHTASHRPSRPRPSSHVPPRPPSHNAGPRVTAIISDPREPPTNTNLSRFLGRF